MSTGFVGKGFPGEAGTSGPPDFGEIYENGFKNDMIGAPEMMLIPG